MDYQQQRERDEAFSVLDRIAESDMEFYDSVAEQIREEEQADIQRQRDNARFMDGLFRKNRPSGA